MAELGKKTLRSWRRLEKAQELISGRIEHALKSAGLPPLVWLRAFEEMARADGGAVRPFELQGPLGLEQPAVSRLLDRMADAGMVARQECAEDRRGWTVAPTPLGGTTADRMAEIYAASLSAHYLAHLSEKQARALDEILGDLLDAARS